MRRDRFKTILPVMLATGWLTTLAARGEVRASHEAAVHRDRATPAPGP